MNLPYSKVLNVILVGVVVALGLFLFVAVSKDRTSSPYLTDTFRNILNKNEILSQMRTDLLYTQEMERNAVMARTDEESQKFADQWLASAATVDEKLLALRSLIDDDSMQDEKKLVVEFDNCWVELRKLDQVILEFSGQNTNLKAANLSRGKGAVTIQSFESALLALIESSSGSPGESQVVSSSYRAIIAALKIYNLHSPHIAEASDENMDLIEARINAEKDEISRALDDLTGVVGKEYSGALLQAKTAFSEFMEVTAEVIVLSRENSNVKSLELSLGRKRTVATQCDEILATFLKTVHNRSFKATK